MVDASALREISSIDVAIYIAATANVLLVFKMFSGAPAWFQQWIAYRRAKAEEKAADWNRLRDEISRLSEAEKQCRRDYAELHRQFMGLSVEVANLRGEVAAREGYQIGQGRAAQDVTILESAKRLSEDKKPPEGK